MLMSPRDLANSALGSRRRLGAHMPIVLTSRADNLRVDLALAPLAKAVVERAP